MKNLFARMFALFLLLFPLFVAPSHAVEKKEAVVLMPMRATKDIPQDEMTQYEAALVKSLSEKYVVYSGQRVLEKVNDVYKKRSGEAQAGKECDETKCLQDVAIAFQTELVAVANIRKSGGGYSISLAINDVAEDKSVFANSIPCEGCNEFEVTRRLQTLAGSGAAPVDAPSAQAAKGAGSNDMELAFWNSIKDGANTADFEAYLQAYPNGTFVQLAKRRAVKSPAQIADEKAAAEKAEEEAARAAAEKSAGEEVARAAAEKAAIEKTADEKFAALQANPPEGMVAVKQEVGGFYMDKTEVTQEAYQRVIGSNPSEFKKCPTCPVETVNWGEAVAYCEKVGKRLPTETMWEYAATSGGKKEAYAGGNDLSKIGDYAWYEENSGGGLFSSGKTHPVGGKKPNGLGVYDMSGNVAEWTDGRYEATDEMGRFLLKRLEGKEGKVIRGGSWFNNALMITVFRYPFDLGMRSSDIGFRCSQ